MATAYTDEYDRIKAETSGANEFLNKPILIPSFVNAL